MIKIPLVYNFPTCDSCGDTNVDIFDLDGGYCLYCWNKLHEP